MKLPACRFDDPKTVVATFIRAMNAWELSAAGLTKDGITSWPIIKQEVDTIFACFCTPKDRPCGRLGSFQSPPEYDPAHEEIIDFTMESPKKSFVDTRREAVLGGGEYRYVLHLCDGKWLIDNLKLKEPDGSYSKAML